MNPFVYFWNHALDREFLIPENIVHFENHLPLKSEPWMLGHCYGNSFARKYGFGNTRRYGYKKLKADPRLEIAVGIIVRKTFYLFVSNGEIDLWKTKLKKALGLTKSVLEPEPQVLFHAWNIYDGKVVDFTLGNLHTNYEYLGFVVPEKKGKTFRDAPCVRRYLDELFGFGNDVLYVRREGRSTTRKVMVE